MPETGKRQEGAGRHERPEGPEPASASGEATRRGRNPRPANHCEGAGRKGGWRGEWYVYNCRKNEFLKTVTRAGRRCYEDPDLVYAVWSPGIIHARAYKNPSMAQKAANRIEAAMNAGRMWPRESPYREQAMGKQGTGIAALTRNKAKRGRACKVVTVVSGEAARCLDMINRRQ